MTKIKLALVYGFFFLQQLAVANTNAIGDRCHSVDPIQLALGDPLNFVCPEHHNGKSYFYIHNSTTQQYQLIYNDSHRFHTIIASFDDAEEYCCTKHHGETLQVNRSRCCIQVEVPTTIKWNLPEGIPYNESVYGTCNITSKPAPNVTGNLLDIHNCEYQFSTIVVDKYMVTVNFIIHDATQSCYIYCHSGSNGEWKILMVGPAPTTNTTNSSPPPPTNTSISISKPTPNTNITSTETTSDINASISLPTPNNTSATEQQLEDNTSTNDNSEEIYTTAGSPEMTVLLVVVLVLLLMMTATLILVIWISIRGIKRNVSIT